MECEYRYYCRLIYDAHWAFRSDYHLTDFEGYDHDEWIMKRKITATTRGVVQGQTKVIEVITGMFQGWAFRPESMSVH